MGTASPSSTAALRFQQRSEVRRSTVADTGTCGIAVHYPPEFDVDTLNIVPFEAPARWNHSALGPDFSREVYAKPASAR